MKSLKVSSKNSTADTQVIDFFKEIIKTAKQNKTILHTVFSDINDKVSSEMIKILQKEEENLTIVVLLKQNIKVNIKAQVLYCNAIENQLPFKLLVVAGDDSYLIARTNECSGSISCPEAASEARSVLKNIMSVYI